MYSKWHVYELSFLSLHEFLSTGSASTNFTAFVADAVTEQDIIFYLKKGKKKHLAITRNISCILRRITIYCNGQQDVIFHHQKVAEFRAASVRNIFPCYTLREVSSVLCYHRLSIIYISKRIYNILHTSIFYE